jgi:DNA (cytosine-5)-methyltransferase 1
MPATDLCHPTELRPLSVEEYSAIQTYPPDFVFLGSTQDKYRQIGNAVPCLFGEAIARHIVAFDEGKLASLPSDGRLSRYACTDHESWNTEWIQQELPI